MARARRQIEVSGLVQGVGFRPYVVTLARALGLSGQVANHGGRVAIEAEGELGALEALEARLAKPELPGARVDGLRSRPLPPCGGEGFEVIASDASQPSGLASVPCDRATCAACRAELADPADRRAGYAFTSCAACGPRLTILLGMPYDRERTTMAGFPLCAACRREYEDPADRRFHVEAIACPACGPALRWLAPGEAAERGQAALAAAARALEGGRLIVVRGLGGYHLACDARDAAAVARLRAAKGRDDKPFALLVADLAAARALVRVDAAEEALLTSPEAPIVLCERGDGAVAAEVAPRAPRLGVMLAYSPLHEALARALARPLVLTSANPSEEPMPTDELEARAIVALADGVLEHDRPIAARVDDSVAQVVAGGPTLLRLGRGYAPASFPLPAPAEPAVLAVGGDYKSAFAIALGERVAVSQHHGELSRRACLEAFERSIERHAALLGAQVGVIAHDLHPDFCSTRYAEEHARRTGARRIAVQHHHAHFAATLLEARADGPAIGLIFDGVGLGLDGAAWGGEVFAGDAASVERVAHLAYVAQPGGDLAAREGWRMALAHLEHAGLADDPRARELLERAASAATVRTSRAAAARGIGAPRTSSVGRLFDAVAFLSGVCLASGYEGQAAIELEWAAARSEPAGEYPARCEEGAGPARLDPRPIIEGVLRDVADGVAPGRIARRFHDTLITLAADTAAREAARRGLRLVALGGGCFANVRLVEGLARRLEAQGLRVLIPRKVPAGDGGLCLGQVAVTLARARA